MLDFWYSERCTRQIKLIACVSVCIIIYLSSQIYPLTILHTVIALCLGAIYHFKHYAQKNIKENNPYKTIFSILFFVIPLIIFISLLISLPNLGRLYLIIQTLGFILIGFFLVSIYVYRTKR